MKKLFKFFVKHPIYLLFAFICIAFLPRAIIAEPQSRSKLIVRAIGIDKTEEGFQASAIAFTPKSTQTFSENYKVVEGKGQTLYDALSAISTEAGKEVALAHANVVFVDDEVCKSGLVETLDYLVRDYSLGNDTFVVYVPNSASDIIKQTQSLVQSSGIKIEEISQYDNTKILINKSDLETIYYSAFSKSRCALLNVMELGENGLETSGGSSEGASSQEGTGQQEGQGQSQENDQQNQKILNTGKALVIKDGKKALVLGQEQTKQLRLTKPSKQGENIILENFTDSHFNNATVILSLTKNNVKTKAFFLNGKPCLKFYITPSFQISEVNQEKKDDSIYVGKRQLGSPELKAAANAKIKREALSVLEFLAQNNVDVVEAYDAFDSKFHNQFEAFLSEIDNKEEYIKQFTFEVEVNSLIS